MKRLVRLAMQLDIVPSPSRLQRQLCVRLEASGEYEEGRRHPVSRQSSHDILSTGPGRTVVKGESDCRSAGRQPVADRGRARQITGCPSGEVTGNDDPVLYPPCLAPLASSISLHPPR
jgi:hypothetical protein